MRLPHEQRRPFNELTEVIARYWQLQAATAPRTDDVILVDLQHNNLNCLLTCLTGARYLSIIHGAGLVGLIGQNTTQRLAGHPSDYDADTVRRLAESFGVEAFVPADAGSLLAFTVDRPPVQEAIRAELARFDATWAASTDEQRWRRAAAFRTADGIPIGLDVADSVANITGDPRPGAEAATITRALVLESLQLRALGDWVCDTAPVIAYVTSHIGYASWATMAATVSARGGEVVHAETLGAGSSYTFIAPGPGRVADRRAHQLAGLFDELRAIRTRTHAALRSKTAVLVGSSLGPPGGWWPIDQASAVDRRPDSATRRAALAKLHVRDPQRPVVFVLSHCLTDVPRQAGGLYEDYHSWLVATLDIAARTDDRTWVVRVHPWHRQYREEATVAAIKRRYAGFAHIRFDDGLLSKDEYFSTCALGVTVRGSAAWELGRWDIPVIAAGTSWYERAGFVHRPATVQDYERLLRTPPDRLPPLPDACDAANSFSLFASLLLPLAGPLLPPPDPFPHANLLATLAARYRSTTLELDPAFRAVAQARATAAAAALNDELLTLLREDPPEPPDAPATEPSEGGALGALPPARAMLHALLDGWLQPAH